MHRSSFLPRPLTLKNGVKRAFLLFGLSPLATAPDAFGHAVHAKPNRSRCKDTDVNGLIERTNQLAGFDRYDH